MGELLEMFPDAPTILRPGPISAWDDPNFVKAVEGLGRKKLIMAGVTIDVCLMFPVQQAIAAGFEVYAVYDTSGCWDQLSELTSIMRLIQMGAIVCNSLAVVADSAE
jgi:nicotinamidase-related amidase